MTAPPHAKPPAWAGDSARITTIGDALDAGWQWTPWDRVRGAGIFWFRVRGENSRTQLVIARPVPEPTVTVEMPRSVAERLMHEWGTPSGVGPLTDVVGLIRTALNAGAAW